MGKTPGGLKMKKYYWTGIVGLCLFEIANVYFIMPMPGSQQLNSINLAYFLYQWRWAFRVVFGLMILIGFSRSRWIRKWIPALSILFTGAVIYLTNFVMAADAMFKQPAQLLFSNASENMVDNDRLVLGVSINNEAKAYPIQFLGYHHHIQDTVGGKPVLITYCTVCRTGRVFEPIVNGKKESFRLVGMDHFNAMLEDATTQSWWRQVTGEAIAGILKGQQLPEIQSTQATLAMWLILHPQSLIMQADPAFIKNYDSTLKYEDGSSRKKLTGTDTLSWQFKSWVVGIKAGKNAKAYDWNRLKQERIIHDTIGSIPILLVLAEDNKSFFGLQRNSVTDRFTLNNDTLIFNQRHFRLDGRGLDTTASLKNLPSSQEFWHSWKTFYPQTSK